MARSRIVPAAISRDVRIDRTGDPDADSWKQLNRLIEKSDKSDQICKMWFWSETSPQIIFTLSYLHVQNLILVSYENDRYKKKIVCI